MSESKRRAVTMLDTRAGETVECTIVVSGDCERMSLLDPGGEEIVTVEAHHAFACLVEIRLFLEQDQRILLCNGARTDVYPSGMSAQLSGGMTAYVMKPGASATMDDLVDILEPAFAAQIGSVADQEAYRDAWHEGTAEAIGPRPPSLVARPDPASSNDKPAVDDPAEPTVTALDMSVYAPSRQAWVTAEPQTASTMAKLLTFNVSFAEEHFDERAEGLLDVLRAQNAHVIALQEVTRLLLCKLLAAPWIRDRYAVTDVTGTTFSYYGVVLLSRLPIRRVSIHKLPSRMNRRLLVAETVFHGLPLQVATVHLESMRHESEARATQLAQIFRILAGADHTVLMGDMNMCSSSEENNALDPLYLDVWPAIHADKPGYTEDTTINSMRLRWTGNPKHVRYDRILLRSAGSVLQPRAVELLGTHPVVEGPEPVFVSDHFGVVATLELST